MGSEKANILRGSILQLQKHWEQSHPGRWFVEDSLYALQTAGNAGFLTAGIYDALGEPDQEQLKKDAYIYCRDLTELQNHIFTENGGNQR